MTPADHLVEIVDRTGAVFLRCHTCPWTALIEAGTGRPLVGDEYAAIRYEAATLKSEHETYGTGA